MHFYSASQALPSPESPFRPFFHSGMTCAVTTVVTHRRNTRVCQQIKSASTKYSSRAYFHRAPRHTLPGHQRVLCRIMHEDQAQEQDTGRSVEGVPLTKHQRATQATRQPLRVLPRWVLMKISSERCPPPLGGE